MEYLETLRDRGRVWFRARAHGAHAKAWLFLLSFTEASFFIIAPDLLLIAVLLAGAERWRYYAGLTTLASVLGGVFGYAIGAFFYDTVGEKIVAFYHLEDEIRLVGAWFERDAFWVMLVSAFTPIPYKVFVLAGGFFKIDFLAFLLASVLGRGARFYLVAWLVRRFGERITHIVFRYFTLVTYALVALIALWLLVSFDLVPALL